MKQSIARSTRRALVCAAAIAAPALAASAQQNAALALSPSTMPKLAVVDPRFASYNVEMVEVTGGRFWKPYKSAAEKDAAPAANQAANANQQVGVSSSLFEFRPPIDLSNPRLRKLAAALGPSYIRVSGSWQNSTFFQDDDKAPLAQAPKGFRGVLTRAEWKGVVDFAHATGGAIVTSFAISPGTRDAGGVWTPAQAKAVLDYTKSIGGSIAVTEFMNEPTFPGPGGAPEGYDAAAFARDAKIFREFVRKESPQTMYVGPGSVGEGLSLMPSGAQMKLILSDDILKATGPIFDAFSYHFYGTVSSRCMGTMTLEKTLTAEWLDRTDVVESFYAGLRDKYTPGKPMWLTETAEAACGGDPFAGQYVDAFRYLNQLGALAQKGVKAVMHNTLASSDYGLLDENTLEPRPDFWAAVLWKRTMGAVVLDPGGAKDQPLRIYANCAKDRKGAVTVLALNTDTAHEQALTLPQSAERFTLTAPDLAGTAVLLNGTALKAGPDGSISPLTPDQAKAGPLSLPPSSITFLTFPATRNKSCMGSR